MSNDAMSVMKSVPNGASPSPSPLSPDQALEAYRDMLKIRRFEEKAGLLYAMGNIGGFCHLSIGQEAVIVGLQMTTQKGDQVITGYRCHGHMLAAGLSAKGVMAELTGRASGYCKGKGGSMHLFAKDHDFYGGHGIDAACVPLGAGLAFANRYRGNDNVCLCYFDDGSANQGQVHETVQMAKRWKLPIVFVMGNNTHTVGISPDHSSSTKPNSSLGLRFDLPGLEVDGMDVQAVNDAGVTATTAARTGRGPFVLEMLMSPYRGHAMSDTDKQSSKDGAGQGRKVYDPIRKAHGHLLALGHDEDFLAAIDRDVRSEINAAAQYAQSAPEPEASELETDVLS